MVCSTRYETTSLTSKYCSGKCRKAAFKARQDVPERQTERRGTTVTAVIRELEAADRLDTYLGQSAIALAERIDSSTAVMGFAALVKELRSTMDAALDGAKQAMDPLDELRARRDRKLASG